MRDSGRRQPRPTWLSSTIRVTGSQMDRQNYLVPVDAVLQRERDVVYDALPLRAVLAEVSGAGNWVWCSSMPAGTTPGRPARTEPRHPDLTGRRRPGPVEDVPSRTLVAFSTTSNTVAYDGEGTHSPYTAAFLKFMPEADLELQLMLRQVRATVLQTTGGAQEPREDAALGPEPFFFHRRPPNRPPMTASGNLEVLDNAAAVQLGLSTPTDPDGDALTVSVLTLPSVARSRAGRCVLRQGSVLPATELAQLSFEPSGAAPGDAGAFAYRILDGRGGEAFADARNPHPVVEPPAPHGRARAGSG